MNIMNKEDEPVNTGVKVVGAPIRDEDAPEDAPDIEETPSQVDDPGEPRGRHRTASRPRSRSQAAPRRRLLIATSALAVLGLLGTAIFGLLWAGSTSSNPSDPAMISSARSFLTDLTNFNAKSVDADFSSITSMATGTFSSQATKFFNSSIRGELEQALAESRGQIRNIYIQSDNGTTATVYAVVDQVYVNNKISTPQSDVLRVLVNLQRVGSNWKISDVTVLEGATPASTGSASGSAGSSVPGQ